MKTLKLTALAALLGVVGSTPAFAQETQSATASATIGTTLALEVTNLSVGFSSITSGDFDTGHKAASSASVVSHRGNVRHSVTIAADAATFTGSAGTSLTDVVRATKPASDLEWSLDAFGTAGSSLSTTAADVVKQAAAGVHDDAKTVSYRMLLAYANDTPGDYEIGFTFTIAAD